MVLLPQGSPLSWSETKKLSNYVRDHGIEQYINVYRQWKNRNGDVFKWGDEVHAYEFIRSLFLSSNILLQYD